ncbi:MAG: PD-(D/E)XK nuclease family protein [Planctomycetes bacterium]|jgi:hypothetical protein|nr:PD-(D/E)XK nuclease family protein [Planctomycetota bacterium]
MGWGCDVVVQDLCGIKGRALSSIMKVLAKEGAVNDAEEIRKRGRQFWQLCMGIGQGTLSKLDVALESAGMPWAEVAMVPAQPKREGPTIRASALNLGLTCPGSIFLSARLKRRDVDTSTSYTSVGTLGHAALELAFTQGSAAMRQYLETQEAGLGFIQEIVEFLGFLATEGKISLAGAMSTRCEAPMQYQAGEVLVTGTRDLVQVQGDRAVVADWKFYNDPSMLPDIAEDIQMIAYGVGTAAELNLARVDVRRYLVYYRRAEVIELEGTVLELAKKVVQDEAETAWAGRATFNVGAQCRTCLVRQHCTAYRNHGRDISTAEIAPYVEGTFTAPEQVLRFLLAVPLVEERLEAGMAAAKAWILENGSVADPVSGHSWGPQQRDRDEIVDAAGCLAELMKLTDQKTALAAAKTTKSGIEDGLKGKGVAPDGRRAFLDRLRELGLIRKKRVERWEWR